MRFNVILALGLLLSQTAAVKYLNDEQEALKAPVHVNIGLVGFGRGSEFPLGELDLTKLLKMALPEHQPSCVNTGRPLALRYNVQYNVKHHPDSQLKNFEILLAQNLKLVDPEHTRHDGEFLEYTVDASKMEHMVETMVTAVFGADTKGHTLLLVNPHLARLVEGAPSPMGTRLPPETKIKYHYSYFGAGNTQSWVGAGRHAVVDFAAGPTFFGATNAMEGSVVSGSLPRLHGLAGLPPKLAQARGAHITASLVAVVVSAVEHVLVPDVQCDFAEFSEKVYVPIIVFRNHEQFDPLQPEAGAFYINVNQIRQRVNQLALPGQKIEVIGDTQDLGKHVAVARTIARAIREDTVHEPSQKEDGSFVMRMRPYLDSAIIRHEFNKSLHMLDALGPELLRGRPDLWSFLHPAVPEDLPRDSETLGADFKHSRLHLADGTRVLPVYIFSLLGLQRDILIDQRELVSTGPDGMFVLQTGTPSVAVPFFDGGITVSLLPRQSTQHIIAGLATALGGLASPTTRVSRPHQRTIEEYMWAAGCNPWGAFSRTDQLSKMALDMVVRNFVASRLDMAQHLLWRCTRLLDGFTQRYLYDPFAATGTAQDAAVGDVSFASVADGESTDGASPFPVKTVAALEAKMEELQAEFHTISALLGSNDNKEAYFKSIDALNKARKFERYAEDELLTAETELLCCDVEHHVNKAMDYVTVLYIIVVVFIVYVAALRWADPSRKSGGRKQ